MKKIFFITAFSFLIILAGVDFFYLKKNNAENNFSAAEIKIKNSVFKTKIAADEKNRERGLSGIEDICQNCGMLFIFEKEGIYPFWMKDMRFNLDIIWIKGRNIVKIAENVSYLRGMAEVIDPGVLADKVLEIKAGKSEEAGMRQGDQVDITSTD